MREKGFIIAIVGIMLLSIACTIAWYARIVYIAAHFIAKFW